MLYYVSLAIFSIGAVFLGATILLRSGRRDRQAQAVPARARRGLEDARKRRQS